MEYPRALKSVGIKVFIDEYEYFKNQKNKQEIIEYLVSKQISNKNGAKIRADSALDIFSDTNLLCQCLNYIIHGASRVDNSLRVKAQNYLDKLIALQQFQ